jgi:hypothetical protein
VYGWHRLFFHIHPSPMIVCDFHVVGVARLPPKADPPPLVDADAVLAFAVSFQLLSSSVIIPGAPRRIPAIRAIDDGGDPSRPGRQSDPGACASLRIRRRRGLRGRQGIADAGGWGCRSPRLASSRGTGGPDRSVRFRGPGALRRPRRRFSGWIPPGTTLRSRPGGRLEREYRG